MNEIIEKLKQNKTAFGLLSEKERKLLTDIKERNCERFTSFGWAPFREGFLGLNTYRIKSDYQPEMEEQHHGCPHIDICCIVGYHSPACQHTGHCSKQAEIDRLIKLIIKRHDKPKEPVEDPEYRFVCPNCKRERFVITIDTLTKWRSGFDTGIIKVECECGLITTFDWNKANFLNLGPWTELNSLRGA
jgi:hypothetical protein